MTLESGLTATVSMTVTADDTAVALGSGDVEVLGTPAVLALAERAAVAAVAGRLPQERTTVGSRVELDHLAPTRVGATVTATATLVEADGNRLEFRIGVAENGQEVARVVHRRVIAARARFC